jgi:hypothetical protein
VDLLPGGGKLEPECDIAFPLPREVSDTARLISLEDLISLKLDSWKHSPLHRLKDKADVVELIKRAALSRELAVDAKVKELYLEIWDGLHG